MANPYELLAGLALLREKNRRSRQSGGRELQEWSGFQMRFGDLDCLIRREQVEEVVTPSSVAAVRGVPAWVKGVIYSHTQLVTLVDVGKLLTGSSVMQPGSSRAFVVRGGKEWFGLLASSFEGVRHIWSDTPDCPPPEGFVNQLQAHIREWLLLDERPVAVLDATSLVKALESSEVAV